MKKYQKLLLGLIFDAVGMISYLLPGIGEFTDVIWAPISAWLMTKLYKGKTEIFDEKLIQKFKNH